VFSRMSVEEFDTTKLLAQRLAPGQGARLRSVRIVDVDSHHYENESMAEISTISTILLKQLALAGARADPRTPPRAQHARWLPGLAAASRAMRCATMRRRRPASTSATPR